MGSPRKTYEKAKPGKTNTHVHSCSRCIPVYLDFDFGRIPSKTLLSHEIIGLFRLLMYYISMSQAQRKQTADKRR